MKVFIFDFFHELFYKKLILLGFLLTNIAIAVTDSRTLTVVYSANNEQYLEGAIVSIASVLEHANQNDDYHFYIYATEALAREGISECAALQLKTLKTVYSNHFTVHVIPMDYLEEAKSVDVKHWGIAGVLRMALPRLLPLVNKVIYMDCDMVTVKDLRFIDDFLDSDDEYAVAGIVDIGWPKETPKLCKRYKSCDFINAEYINSGLLVMHLDRLRQEQFTKKVFRWLTENPDATLPDQDALNVVYKNKIKVYDMTYAWPSFLVNDSEDVVIIHFLGNEKPWKNPNALHVDLYKSYLAQPHFVNIHAQVINNMLERKSYAELSHFLDNHLVDLELRDANGLTYLMIAVLQNDENFVVCLLDNKADIDAQDHLGRTALIIASERGFFEIAAILLAYGANAHLSPKSGLNLDAVLTLASGSPMAINDIEKSFSLESEDPKSLVKACKKNNFNRVYFLLNNGANPNGDEISNITPLIQAVKVGHTGIVQLLLQKGADVTKTDGGTWTAYEWALNNIQNPNIPQLILTYAKQLEPAKMLHFGANSNIVELIELALQSNSIDINCPDAKGMTPLITAVRNGHLEAVNILLAKGADVTKTDGGTWTAYEWAKAVGHNTILEVVTKARRQIKSNQVALLHCPLNY